jgi:hypothetical protein
MTAGGFADGRYFATTQVKIQRTSFLSRRIMAEQAVSLNIKIAIAPEIAMEGWFSTELELNSTARQPAAAAPERTPNHIAAIRTIPPPNG